MGKPSGWFLQWLNNLLKARGGILPAQGQCQNQRGALLVQVLRRYPCPGESLPPPESDLAFGDPAHHTLQPVHQLHQIFKQLLGFVKSFKEFFKRDDFTCSSES